MVRNKAKRRTKMNDFLNFILIVVIIVLGLIL